MTTPSLHKGLSNAGEFILVASPVDAGITVWDLVTGAECLHLRSCATSRHGLTTVGRYFVAASQIQKTSSANNGSIVYWSWNKPQPEIKSFPVEHIGPVVCNNTGTYIAGGGSSGRVYLWEVATGHLLRVWSAHYKAITCLIFSDDESLLVTGAEDGFLKAWTLITVLDAAQSESHVQPLQSFSAHTLPVTDLVSGYGGGNAIIVSAALDFTCKIWGLSLGVILRTIKFPAAVNAVVLDHGEYALYAGCSDGVIYVSALNVGASSENIHREGFIDTLVGHSGAITALAFSMDGVLLVSGSEDCTVRVWDTVSHQVLRMFKHPKGPINNLILVPYTSCGVNQTIQSNFPKRGSFLTPSPLNKYTEPKLGDLGHGLYREPLVILPVDEVNPADNSCIHTVLSMKEQMKALEQQSSSSSVCIELERLKSEHQRSLHMIQQWQHVYQDLHNFCVTELMAETKTGEEEDITKTSEKGKKERESLLAVNKENFD